MVSRTKQLEREARDKRWARTGKLQDTEKELRALAQQLYAEDSENGWHVRYIADPYMHALVTIDGKEFARFSRDEAGLIGVFCGTGKPERFATKEAAFDAAVRRRIARRKLR